MKKVAVAGSRHVCFGVQKMRQIKNLHEMIILFLQSYITIMNSNQQAYFLDACRNGNEEDVKKICELLPELVNAADEKGFTPLIIASYNNHPQVVATLLKNGAAPDAQDSAGNTALMGACYKGYKEVAEQLLHAGANVNLRNNQDAPALTFAATFGQLEIAKILLEQGADPTLQDNRGKTSLDHALLQENEAMSALLLSYSKQS